ncbi:MAG: lipocalin-like domain-containing protein [Actinomycetota bacterium]|nr:lipocalin-like domain-containing protein [Actinomycetota bacterium]
MAIAGGTEVGPRGGQTWRTARGSDGAAGSVGAWKLVSYELRYADGKTVYPLSREPNDYLVYTADGHMCRAMMSGDRPRFAGDNFQIGDPEDQTAAARTYLPCRGPYEVAGTGWCIAWRSAPSPSGSARSRSAASSWRAIS